MSEEQSRPTETSASDQLRRAQDLVINARSKFGFEVFEAAREMESLHDVTRRPWLEVVVLDLLREQDGRCALCLKDMTLDNYEVDHIVPLVHGGGNHRANIQLAHPECNRSKGAEVSPEVLLSHLEDLWMNR